MNSDHAFVIGHSHKVCEDYARSGNRMHSERGNDLSYAFISDGCSGSNDSDVGARVLVASAEQFLLRRGAIGDVNDVREMVSSAASIQRLMGMDETMLDATLFGVYAEGGQLDVFGIGDGVIALKTKIGELRLYEFDAPSGYPLYPSYLLSRSRRDVVLDKVRSHESSGWSVAERGDPDVTCPVDVFESREVDVYGRRYLSYGDMGEAYIESVAVFSDGVKTFVDENRKAVPWTDVVRELMAFKGYKGEFAKRRMQGFLRACDKRGWQHDDDVSMGAVWLG